LAPKALLPIRLLFRIQRIQVTYDVDSGAASTESFGKMKRYADELSLLDADAWETHEALATTALLEAHHVMREAQDPIPEIEKARIAFDRAIEKDPQSLSHKVWRARLEIVGIRWAMKQHKASAPMFEAARAPLQPVLAQERDDPSPYQTLAEIYGLRAAWLLDQRKTPNEDITQGLAMADKALSKNPRLATALATKGHLHLLQARAARDRSARSQAAQRATDAFASAFRENPLLKRSYDASLAEATQLL
jgi:hypothetical protein